MVKIEEYFIYIIHQYLVLPVVNVFINKLRMFYNVVQLYIILISYQVIAYQLSEELIQCIGIINIKG